MVALGPNKLILPSLYHKQRASIFAPERYAVIEASTKVGKTVGCLVWQLFQAASTGKDGRNYWWVAPVFTQAKMAYRRMRRMLHRADPTRRFWAASETELRITIWNGGSLWFKSADKPDSLYGEDVYAAVVDEATRCKEQAWHAIRSTLTSTGGPIRIIGNVKGRKNWAYQLARKAQSGDPAMHYAKLTAYDAVEGGILSLAEVEDAQRMLPEDVFRELYLAEPSDDGGNPFGLQHIRRCVIPSMGEGPVEAWGADLAKKRDWTVSVGLNSDCTVAAFQRWQSDWKRTRAVLAAMFKGTPALVDSTGVGDPIVEDIQRQCSSVEGYGFTPRTKQQLMEGLALAIQNERVHFPDGPIVNELETFEYEYTRTGVRYTAPPGMHDDCVCALALAVMCKARAPGPLEFSLRGRMSEYIETDPHADGYDVMRDEALWTPIG